MSKEKQVKNDNKINLSKEILGERFQGSFHGAGKLKPVKPVDQKPPSNKKDE